MKKLGCRNIIFHLVICLASAVRAGIFPDAHDAPPTVWNEHVFKLSQDYPQTLPTKEAPWEQIDFKIHPAEYMKAVLDYCIEGNTNAAVDWDGHANPVRKWYHTPWLHTTPAGREFVRGLTKERPSRARELHPNQPSQFDNWAVGMYNPRGGYRVGKVWANPTSPNLDGVKFSSGTAAVKLLFTMATTAEVPFLHDSKEWKVDIHRNPNNLATVRLLQVDIAVRDTDNSDKTGWVFGTFIYNGDAPGNTVWKRLVPVGLIWGNDSGVTSNMVFNGTGQIKESWINPAAQPLMQHLGWAKRLNGPVDNPLSSCLSCHSTAQLSPNGGPKNAPSGNASDTARLDWFRNVKAGKLFRDEPGAKSLDYSLQLRIGIERFRATAPPASRDGDL